MFDPLVKWPSLVGRQVPVMRNSDGEKLAKRDGSAAIEIEKNRGKSAPHIIGQLAASYGLVRDGSDITPEQLLRQLSLARMIACLS